MVKNRTSNNHLTSSKVLGTLRYVVKHALVSQLSEDNTSALVAALADDGSKAEEGTCDDTASDTSSDNDPASNDEQDFYAADQQ